MTLLYFLTKTAFFVFFLANTGAKNAVLVKKIDAAKPPPHSAGEHRERAPM
jgi:hypothetical protein